VIDFNWLSLKLSGYIFTPWIYGSRGAQYKTGVSYCRSDLFARMNLRIDNWGQNRWILKPQTSEIAISKIYFVFAIPQRFSGDTQELLLISNNSLA
jgi:hypothetical protein